MLILLATQCTVFYPTECCNVKDGILSCPVSRVIQCVEIPHHSRLDNSTLLCPGLWQYVVWSGGGRGEYFSLFSVY